MVITMKAVDLRTEYLKNPIAIDIGSPRLFWKAEGGNKQTAYQIVANLDHNEVFDTGKVSSAQMNTVLPKKFESRRRVVWRIRLWDESDRCGSWSEAAFFEMGLLHAEDWKGKWIDPEVEQGADPDAESEPGSAGEERKPASYLKKKFFLQDDKGDARLYITAHGVYEAHINGIRVGNFILAPGTSQYNKRLQYQTYDVSALLQKGENEILISVGDGWWRGDTGYAGIRNSFGKDIGVLCQLEISRKIILISDESWMASQSGPIGFNDLMQGEYYDAGKENITHWHAVRERDFGYENLVCSNSFDVVEKERFRGKRIVTPDNDLVIDFGQNLAGYVEFHIKAGEGQTITIYHGECLDQNGRFTRENFQAPNHRVEQCVKYICKEGWNTYKPSKSIFGFQYIKVETDIPVSEENFTAIAVYSDMSQTAEFVCGNQEINQLFQNALWSMKGNFLEVPTDCPTRERSGFTGDAQVFVNTGLYFMDCYPVYRKFLNELGAAQREDGCVTQVAPTAESHLFDGSAGWSDAIALIPWRMYLRYGNPDILKENYERIKKWVLFNLNRAKKDNPGRVKEKEKYSEYLLDTGWHWGEWIEPDWNGFISCEDAGGAYLQDIYNHGAPEVCTSHLSYTCHIAAEAAKLLNREEDAVFFGQMRDLTKKAYREVCMKDGHMIKRRQCDYVHAIMFDMITEAEKRDACGELNEMIIENGYHLNTGFLSTYELLRVLSDYGYADTAYRLLLQTTSPGWLYQLQFQATTVWENWYAMEKGKQPRDSLNHYSFGTYAGWLMGHVAGIQIDRQKVRIQPYPDRRLGYVSAGYDSPMGRIELNWGYSQQEFRLKLRIPSNVQAEVILPDGKRYIVETGSHEFMTNM